MENKKRRDNDGKRQLKKAQEVNYQSAFKAADRAARGGRLNG